MTLQVDKARLDEMLAGLAGVTPGPWKYGHDIYGTDPDDFDDLVIATPGGSSGFRSAVHSVEKRGAKRNGDHIARCDPDTIRSIITELLELRSLRSTEGKEGVCAYPECTCSSKCEDHKFPTLAEAYARVVHAVQVFDDAANIEETNWTGWGEQTVPPAATMRRLKAEQAHRAIRDADPAVYAALTRSPE